MGHDPLISVIVPVYNTEKYFRKSIDSLLNQTYSNLEIILVDDGSPDRCPEICEEYARADERITVIHKKNSGLSSARNMGLDICKGDYIGFLDSDDYVEPDMFQSLLEVIQGEKRAIASTDAIQDAEYRAPEFSFLESREHYLESLLLHIGNVAVWSKLFPRDIIGQIRFVEGKLNEDLLFMFDIEKRFDCIRYMKKPAYHYVVHTDSTSNSFGQSVHDMVENARLIRQYVEGNYPQFREQAERFEIYQNCMFLWLVPSGYDRKGDPLCETAEQFVKRNLTAGLRNRYLAPKDKLRLLLMAGFPGCSSLFFRLHRDVKIVWDKKPAQFHSQKGLTQK